MFAEQEHHSWHQDWRLRLEEDEEFGIPKVTINMHCSRTQTRRQSGVQMLYYLDDLKKEADKSSLGSGRFVGPQTLEVTLPDGATLNCNNVIVRHGTRAMLGEFLALLIRNLPHVEALELDESTEHLLVIGGGYVD